MTLFFDGFEQFARTERPEQLARLADYVLEGTMTMVTGRKGGSAVSLYRAAFSRAWSFSSSIMSVGFAVKFDQRGPIVAIRAGGGTTNLLTLTADATSGLLTIDGNAGYVNPLKARWYYMELELDKTANQVRVFVNGKQDLTVALPAGLGANPVVRLNPYDAATNDFGTRNYDDFYISDGERLKPMQVTTRFPTADVVSDWNVTGASTRFDAVSPPVNMLDKFIFTTVNDNYNSFTSATALPDNNAITHLQLITLFRKATSDPMSLELNIEDDKVTVANISRDWTYRYTLMNPEGYDANSILSAEFGVRLKL